MKTPPVLPLWLMALTVAAIVGALMVTAGCASMDYRWTRTNPPAPQPWFYTTVQDVDRTCREAGVQAIGRHVACAQWTPTHCTIFLPPNAPRWLIEHEEMHCSGFSH